MFFRPKKDLSSQLKSILAYTDNIDQIDHKVASKLGECFSLLLDFKKELRIKINDMCHTRELYNGGTPEAVKFYTACQFYSSVQQLCAKVAGYYSSLDTKEQVLFLKNIGLDNPEKDQKEFAALLQIFNIDKHVHEITLAHLLQCFTMDKCRELLKEVSADCYDNKIQIYFSSSVHDRDENVTFYSDPSNHRITLDDEKHHHVHEMDYKDYEEYLSTRTKTDPSFVEKIYVTVNTKNDLIFLYGMDSNRNIFAYLADPAIFMMHELGHSKGHIDGDAYGHMQAIVHSDLEYLARSIEEIRNISLASFSENELDQDMLKQKMIRFGHKPAGSIDFPFENINARYHNDFKQIIIAADCTNSLLESDLKNRPALQGFVEFLEKRYLQEELPDTDTLRKNQKAP